LSLGGPGLRRLICLGRPSADRDDAARWWPQKRRASPSQRGRSAMVHRVTRAFRPRHRLYRGRPGYRLAEHHARVTTAELMIDRVGSAMTAAVGLVWRRPCPVARKRSADMVARSCDVAF
jgi:hypothetical protein